MLPTEKASNLHINNYYNELFYVKEDVANSVEDTTLINFNLLYILSDEEIKEGDWCYTGQLIRKCVGFALDGCPRLQVNGDDITGCVDYPGAKKIVATTYTSLTPSGTTVFGKSTGILTLPQIPESFIKYFVEKNGKVDEVEVEYEYGGSIKLRRGGESHMFKLKLTDNNEVIIHLPEEDMYTRRMLTKFALNQNIPIPTLDKWIEENL